MPDNADFLQVFCTVADELFAARSLLESVTPEEHPAAISVVRAAKQRLAKAERELRTVLRQYGISATHDLPSLAPLGLAEHSKEFLALLAMLWRDDCQAEMFGPLVFEDFAHLVGFETSWAKRLRRQFADMPAESSESPLVRRVCDLEFDTDGQRVRRMNASGPTSWIETICGQQFTTLHAIAQYLNTHPDSQVYPTVELYRTLWGEELAKSAGKRTGQLQRLQQVIARLRQILAAKDAQMTLRIQVENKRNAGYSITDLT